MPFVKPSAEELDRIARHVRDTVFASDHPLAHPHGRTLADIERTAQALAQRIAADLTAQALADHADHAPDHAPCPQCQQSWKVVRKKRTLITTHGPVEYLEPAAHCFACRSDFFPSSPEAAPRRAAL